jgi:hypothetical protein
MKSCMMKSRLAVAALVSVMLAPALLVAQETGASGQARGEAQSQAQTPQARIDAALSAAASAKIPVELVKSKIAEGEAKRQPPERIATAVEARVKSLTRASLAMQRADIEAQNSGELAVTADALDAGVSESSVIRVSREAAPDRRTVAIAVLADLVRLGNTSERALGRVTAALTTNAALANLHAEVMSQLRVNGLNSTLDAAGIIRIP